MANKHLDYLNSIAPEGETLLLVKKVKTKKFLPNGKPKYTFIPTLPRDYQPGGSWYANTASFVIERLVKRLSASEANCDRVQFLILDDVGTKAKTPPIEPTWVVETSPGNYQYGYTFRLDAQPTAREYAAAIINIAAGGWTDPGAINPVRNFRIEGSDNNGFAAKLHRLQPGREFTLDQICEALGVQKGAPSSPRGMEVALPDDGKDDVMAWLKERGLLLERTNHSGWAGVVCPNHEEHTDGNPAGRYMPATRSYSCFHGHCQDWDSSAFLSWVAESGGPEHESGLRPDLLAAIMGPALAKLQPGRLFKTDLLKEVQARELSRVEKVDWYKRFAYIQSEDAYFDLTNREEIGRSTFNAMYRHIPCHSIHGGRRVEASICFDENRQEMGAPALSGLTYAPGESALCVRDGLVYGNRWVNARPASVPGNIKPWLEHCENLIPNAREREHIFNVMAFKLQFPQLKINHAALHAGAEGCGKDSVWAPFLWAIGGPHGKNRALMDNEALTTQWGYHLESEIIVIPELREPEAKDRRAFANRLKPIIAAPPELLPINRKGLHPYMALNRAFVLSFSNERIPISLSSEDRRWFCVWSSAPRMPDAEGARLWNWYHGGGFDAVAAWLHARNVSQFNPGAAPPMTEFKTDLIEGGMSSVEASLVTMLVDRTGEFQHGAIASPFHPLCNRLSTFGAGGYKVPPAALFHALREAGWVDCGKVHTRGESTKRRVFCHPELAGLHKSELYRLATQLPTTSLTVAK